MVGQLDSGRVDLPCPECGYKNRKTVGWLKTHNQFVCAGCRKVTIDTRGFRQGMRKVDAELDKLTKRLSKGISVNIKL
jgi:hypothetical protein